MDWLLQILGLAPAAAPAVAEASAAAPMAAGKGLLSQIGESGANLARGITGYGGLEKSAEALKNNELDFRGKFDVVAPEMYKKSLQDQAQFGQLQQSGQPQQMQMQPTPSYMTPSMPYRGGGIEELLARQRQRGLL